MTTAQVVETSVTVLRQQLSYSGLRSPSNDQTQPTFDNFFGDFAAIG